MARLLTNLPRQPTPSPEFDDEDDPLPPPRSPVRAASAAMPPPDAPPEPARQPAIAYSARTADMPASRYGVETHPMRSVPSEPLPTPRRRRGGAFRFGFGIVLVAAALLLLVYSFAPVIAAQVPALAPALTDFTAYVDRVRLALDGTLRSLLAGI